MSPPKKSKDITDFDMQQFERVMNLSTAIGRIETEMKALSKKMDDFIRSNQEVINSHTNQIQMLRSDMDKLQGSLSGIKYVIGVILALLGLLGSFIAHLHW